jgi:hypothetical protein
MDQYFDVCGIKIPTELSALYKEVSRNFEKKVMDSIKPDKEENNEKNKEISKKLNYSRRLH